MKGKVYGSNVVAFFELHCLSIMRVYYIIRKENDSQTIVRQQKEKFEKSY